MSQNGHTNFKNCVAFAVTFVTHVWPFWNIMHWRFNFFFFYFCFVNELSISVFLTHVSIRQMPMWLPTWKTKSLYQVGTFLLTRFFLPLQKFKTIKIKVEKNSYTQTNASLLHISRNLKDIFKYMCFTLYL